MVARSANSDMNTRSALPPARVWSSEISARLPRPIPSSCTPAAASSAATTGTSARWKGTVRPSVIKTIMGGEPRGLLAINVARERRAVTVALIPAVGPAAAAAAMSASSSVLVVPKSSLYRLRLNEYSLMTAPVVGDTARTPVVILLAKASASSNWACTTLSVPSIRNARSTSVHITVTRVRRGEVQAKTADHTTPHKLE